MEQATTALEMGDGGVPNGAPAQKYYYKNAPVQVDHPETSRKILNNPGNPVATCGYPPDVYQPKIGGMPVIYQNSDWTKGYGGKTQHPMYTTTASSYGAKAPSVHTMPTQFYAKSQKFSEHLGTCGMYRNFSLNTETDKSKV